jgi:hypothetical protein
MAVFANRLTTIFTPFCSSKFELATDVIFNKLLGFVLAVIGSSFDVYAVPKVFFDKQD